jgi:hypothetical protein
MDQMKKNELAKMFPEARREFKKLNARIQKEKPNLNLFGDEIKSKNFYVNSDGLIGTNSVINSAQDLYIRLKAKKGGDDYAVIVSAEADDCLFIPFAEAEPAVSF